MVSPARGIPLSWSDHPKRRSMGNQMATSRRRATHAMTTLGSYNPSSVIPHRERYVITRQSPLSDERRNRHAWLRLPCVLAQKSHCVVGGERFPVFGVRLRVGHVPP